MKKRIPGFLLLLSLILLIISCSASAASYSNQMVKKGKYTYYYNNSGKIVKNKFVTIENKRYFFDRNGRQKLGFVTYKKQTYYCPATGSVFRNCWKKIGKYYYYFSSGSYISKNKWINGYYVNSKGRCTSKADPTISQQTPAAGAASGTAAGSTTDTTAVQKKTLSVPIIKQRPQLPTGCESVALTMVLNHYKFNLSKTTIASKYLKKSSVNFVTAFRGSPFSSGGFGIYAPGLTITANKFLQDKKSPLKAYDISGASLSSLYRYIDNGTPVIVWNSMYMRNPVATVRYRINGKTWKFFAYEHCVVLCGYDKKTDKVLINDSLSGIVWRKRSSFERIYNKMGKMAIVIQ